jgi:hypothetical protein
VKIIAVFLLLVAFGICFAAFFYLNLYGKSQERCLRYSSMALDKANEAVAAKGTPSEAVLTESARTERELADNECSEASGLKQTAILFIIGAVSSAILAILFLAWAVKRRARAKNLVADRA